MRLLKDIRDGLAGGITPKAPRALRAPGLDGSDDDDDDDDLSTKLNKLNNDVKKIYKYIIILKKVMIKK